ncbi:CAAX prenyl protease 2-like [Astyanax mexicanus]|uniref:CAAX prenyl protease 2 n=1 Tax=Astyanax mexicanus TaxID=7994 RepID=A0A8T2L749_ASTMX|nr:CAAX prenyl protease 2-like [Astyanax mexicanus]
MVLNQDKSINLFMLSSHCGPSSTMVVEDESLQLQPVFSVSDSAVSEVFEGGCHLSFLCCLFLACLYVGSLYVWPANLPRDHPKTIKKRFISVLFASAVSPLVVWAWMQAEKVKPSSPVLSLLGIRIEGAVPAAVLPLILTMLVFRACMLPILVPCTGPTAAIFIAPLFFGVAHFHHVTERLRFGSDSVFDILVCAVFQFSYTSVFGAYTAFIFIRTGHLVGPVLCHSFCNWMGFPALGSALQHPQRPALLLSYELGLLLFAFLLFPLTDPLFYGMTPVCSLILEPRSVCT